jgi:hypothetical protein
MAEKTYSISEVAGTWSTSIEQAIENALNRARETVRNLEWFQVGEVRGAIGEDGVEYQVTLKIGFKLE